LPRIEGTVRARDLRANQTQVEARLWSKLRARRLGGWKWKRQVPRGPYIVDFLCVDAKLVVELDGGQHADNVAYDERRTAYLETQGCGSCGSGMAK
jgi:very-short-patch-repair endonuclease